MAKLGDLVVNIGANTKQLNKELGKVRRSMRQMSSNFTAVGKDMTRSLTLPLALVGGAAVKLAVDFESAMASVKAVSGATAGEFKRLEDSAKDLGASTVFTAREVAALQLEYSRLGFSADEIIRVQEATLNLAQATGSDLAQAADVAGSTLRAFGLDAGETGRITDVMAASFSSSALQIETFQDSMKYVAPIAKAAGISLEETSAMLAVLADSGIRGSQAGTALRRIMQEMSGTSGTLTDRFKQLSAKGIGLTDSMDEVGRRAATSLLVLTNGAGQVDELTSSFENSEGAAKSMSDVMNDTAKGSLKQMTSALEGAGIALGEVLIPFVTQAAGFIKDLATKFKELSTDTKENIVKAVAFAAALGPILIIMPKIVIAMQALRVAAVATSAGMVGLGNVMGVVFGAKTLLGPTKYAAGLRSIVKAKQFLVAGLKRMPVIAAAAFAVAGITSFIGKVKDAKVAVQRYTDHLLIMRDIQRDTDEFIGGEDARLAAQTNALQGSSTAISDYTATLEVLTLDNARFWESYENGEAALAEVEGTVRLSQAAYDILKEKMGSMAQMSEDMLPAALNVLRNELEATIAKLSDTGGEFVVLSGDSVAAAGSIDELRDKVETLRGGLDSSVRDSSEYIQLLADWKAATIELNAALEDLETRDPTVVADAFMDISNGIQTFRIDSSGALLSFLNDFELMTEEIEEMAPAITDWIDPAITRLEDFKTAVQNSMEGGVTAMLSGVGQMIGAGKSFGQAMLAPLAAMAVQLGELAIGYGVAISGIKVALKSLSPGAAIIAGVALVALGSGLQSAISKAAEENLPALAGGGLAFGPTAALVGDNKNASIDPEVIAPLSELKKYMDGGSTNVYGMISGDDIVISNSRAARDRNRYV
tara:strand:+ start:626 stop:3262 length:2637 start_codon:yes stop_codon:yes gene_type:complete